MAKEKIRSILSNNMKKLRSRREWSQVELAEKADISMNYVSDIERGLKWPYPETLQNLASALGVEVFELFKSEEHASFPDRLEYMTRFSNDISTAVEESVKRSIQNIKRIYQDEIQ